MNDTYGSEHYCGYELRVEKDGGIGIYRNGTCLHVCASFDEAKRWINSQRQGRRI